MRSRTIPALLAFAAVILEPATALALNPEAGIFGDAPDPYELELQRSLVGDDDKHRCQMLVIPSFAEEWAVYMLPAKDSAAGYTIVSRSMTKQLWPRMLESIEKNAPDKASYRVDNESEAEALRDIRSSVATRTATLEAALAKRLDAACTQMLLRTRYPFRKSKAAANGLLTYEQIETIGVDGETYHASHWSGSMLLSGQTWTPPPHSLDGDFVDMETSLRAYADAVPSSRRDAEQALALSVGRLEKHLSATAESLDPTPAETSNE